MTLNEEQLENITAFAKGLLNPLEICQIMRLDYESLKFDFMDENTPVGLAYRKGLLELRYEMNNSNIEFAKQGSSHSMNKILEQLDFLIASSNSL
ncbi:hypothetical protein QQ054_32120 [Oscillatoria amoena NRMC-F 0135]|nr:hypothetical protein [Oscillatoria amoena NRMC-F 0135]